jgi:hypothetical protein
MMGSGDLKAFRPLENNWHSKMKNQNKILNVSILVVFIISAGCNPIYADGPYRGRIIDAVTKQPIEGAAVVAIWRKLSGLLVPHPIETIQDAKETLKLNWT